MHYSVSSRTWTGPFAITAASEDVMRTAVAVDGQKRAWVFYSTQRNGNFDLYAKSITAAGTLSAELRLTIFPGERHVRGDRQAKVHRFALQRMVSFEERPGPAPPGSVDDACRVYLTEDDMAL